DLREEIDLFLTTLRHVGIEESAEEWDTRAQNCLVPVHLLDSNRDCDITIHSICALLSQIRVYLWNGVEYFDAFWLI
ncbi:hypothetical protein PENTCL1PPCAC_20721, partial [Pristionchus entomophagus]